MTLSWPYPGPFGVDASICKVFFLEEASGGLEEQALSLQCKESLTLNSPSLPLAEAIGPTGEITSYGF